MLLTSTGRMDDSDWPVLCIVATSRYGQILRTAVELLKGNGHRFAEVQDNELFDSEELLDGHRDKGHLFVCEHFDSEIFKHLVTKHCRVIGPMCIIHCCRSYERLPLADGEGGTPVFTCAMRGVVACCTAFQLVERKQVHELVRLMDGRIEKTLCTEVTHIVAKEWGSEKCKVGHEIGKPIMSVAWVHEAWKQGSRAMCRASDEGGKLMKLRLPVFQGKTICATGTTIDKYEVEELTKSHGGIYSAICHADVTHLLSMEPKGEKYEFALSNSIHIVDPSWLKRCIKLKFPVNERDHQLAAAHGAITGDSVSTEERNLVNKSKMDMNNLYFDGQTFYFAGLSGDRLKLASKIVRIGGGTRVDRIDQSTTHIIHGGISLPQKDEELCSRLGLHPFVLRDSWLFKCCKQRRMLPQAETDEQENIEGESNLQQKVTGSAATPAEDDGFWGMFADTLDSGAKTSTGTVSDSIGSSRNLDANSLEQSSTIFEACTFEINSNWCTMRSNKKLYSLICKRIHQHGGKLAESSECALILLTDIGSPVKARPDSLVVTTIWFQHCLEEGSLLDPRCFRAFQPIHWSTNVETFKRTCLCFSGFDEDVASSLEKVADAVGAKVSSRFSKNVTTHLISMSDVGVKYKKSQEWGIPAVSIDWLFSSVEQKQLLRPQSYPVLRDTNVFFKKCTRETLAASVSGVHTSLNKPGDSDTLISRRSPRKKNIEQTNTVLNGIEVFVSTSKKLDIQRSQIESIVGRLGASLLKVQPKRHCHYIFRGSRNDANKEFKKARQLKCNIVAPDWIFKTHEKNERQPESMYPHTYDPHRALAAGTIAAARQQRPAASLKKLSEVNGSSQSHNSGDYDSDAASDGWNSRAVLPESTAANLSTKSPVQSPQKSPKFKKKEEPTALSTIINTFISKNGKVTGSTRRSRYTSQSEPCEDGEGDDPTVQDQPVEQGNRLRESEDKEPEDDYSQMAVTYADSGQANRRKMLAKLQRRSTSSPYFLLSGLSAHEKNKYSEIINRLGGHVMEMQYFDAKCTHVVVGVPTRSEKYLAACAAGKWVLQTTYLDDSNEMGVFVNEANHEWALNTELITREPSKKALIEATRRWREQVARTSKGAFNSWKVYLFVQKVEGFQRLLEAGGAEVFQDSRSAEITHAFVEAKILENYRKELLELSDRGVMCLKADYIASFLTQVNPLPVDFEALSTSESSQNNHTSPRKRSEVSMNEQIQVKRARNKYSVDDSY